MYSKRLADVALGKSKADMVLKNGYVINVFTDSIKPMDVAISEGFIVGIGHYEGITELDMTGKILCPGFIDSHLHLESTLVRPAELIEAAVRKGTTTFIVDPHEAANVSGTAGIEFILDETENVDANVYVMLPSCVPATDDEDNGASITAEDMKKHLNNPRVLGLGEVMNVPAVLNYNDEMIEKLNVCKGMILDGHAGTLSSKEIMCYKMAGIMTDHECCDFKSAIQEAEAGIQILIREGTAAKNMDAIVKEIIKEKIPTENFCFCTDDKHIAEIEEKGHISYQVAHAVELGIDPISAIKIATINAAKTYRLFDKGAIAPGYQADILVLSDIINFNIEKVFFKGKEIDKIPHVVFKDIDDKLFNTVNIGNVTKESLNLNVGEDPVPIIQIIEGQIQTRFLMENVPAFNGLFVPNKEYNKIAVFERHKATGKTGVGIVKGYSIHNGAIATTFSHDSHNLIVVGDNDDDMLIAIKELIKCGGGYTIANNGKIIDTLELPIMGLISMEDNKTVTKKLSRMLKKTYEMGVSENIDPFINLSFLALPVIPEIRITTRGIKRC